MNGNISEAGIKLQADAPAAPTLLSGWPGRRRARVHADRKQCVYEIEELKLLPGARVNHFEEKAGFALVPDLYKFQTAAVEPTQAVTRAGVLNLTAQMKPDGTLDWTPPAGDWIILRFGYSLTGITNHPAMKEATRLEVDKMDRPAVQR